MIADRPAHNNDVAVLDASERRHYSRQSHADAGRRKIEAAAFTPPQDLGVAGGDTNPGLAGGLRQARDDAIEGGDFEAFLDERVERQVKGPGSGNRKIVDGAVHGKRTDVTAGKFQRLHGKSVRRDQDVAAVQGDRNGICLRVEFFVAEMPREYFFDELAHEAAAVAVRQGNAIVFHHFRAPVDPAARCAAWP